MGDEGHYDGHVEQRSLTTDAAIFLGPVAAKVVEVAAVQWQNRPKEEAPPRIELPPGVEDER